MHRMWIVCMMVVVLSGSVDGGPASQKTFPCTRDAWMEASATVPSRNFGKSWRMRTRWLYADNTQAGLLDFDRQAIRSFIAANGGRIVSAKLVLTRCVVKQPDGELPKGENTLQLWIVRNDFDWSEGDGEGRAVQRGEVSTVAARHSDLCTLADGYWQVDGRRFSDRGYVDGLKSLVFIGGVRHQKAFDLRRMKPEEPAKLDLSPEWLAQYLADPKARGILLANSANTNVDFYTREAERQEFAPRLEVIAGAEGAALPRIDPQPIQPIRPQVEVPREQLRCVVFGATDRLWNFQRAIDLKSSRGPQGYQDACMLDQPGTAPRGADPRIHVGHLVVEKDGKAEDRDFYGWWYLDLAGYLADPANVVALGVPGAESAEDLRVVSGCLLGGLWQGFGPLQFEMYDVASAGNYDAEGGLPDQGELTVDSKRAKLPWATSGQGRLTDLSTFAEARNLLMPTATAFSKCGTAKYPENGFCQVTLESDGFDFLNERGLAVVQRWLVEPPANAGFILRSATPKQYGQIVNSDSPAKALPYRALALQLELTAKHPPAQLDRAQAERRLEKDPNDLEAQVALAEAVAFDEGLEAARQMVRSRMYHRQTTLNLIDKVKLHRLFVFLEDREVVRESARILVERAKTLAERKPEEYAPIEHLVVGVLLYQAWALNPNHEQIPAMDWLRESTTLALQASQDRARQARLYVQLAGFQERGGFHDQALVSLEKARGRATDPHLLGVIDRLVSTVRQVTAEEQRQRLAEAAQNKKTVQDAERRLIEQRIEQARKQGDTARAERLSKTLSQLQTGN